MPLALSPTIALATEAELPILLSSQIGTVGRNHAIGNKREPGARKTCLANGDVGRCARSVRLFSSQPAVPQLDGAGLKLALVEKCAPSGGRGHASRPE